MKNVGTPFWIVNKLNADTAEIYLYGNIGYYDEITASAFVKELRELEKTFSNINIRINSPGGSVYEGFAIFNAIRSSKANIEGYIDGMAASMGTVVAMACSKLHMSKVAQFMTHRVTGGCWGNADEMRKTAETIEAIEDSISDIYASKTGLTKDAAKEKYLGNNDRWISAQQALDEKLIDSIYDGTQVDVPKNVTAVQDKWNAYAQAIDVPKDTNSTIIIL